MVSLHERGQHLGIKERKEAAFALNVCSPVACTDGVQALSGGCCLIQQRGWEGDMERMAAQLPQK